MAFADYVYSKHNGKGHHFLQGMYLLFSCIGISIATPVFLINVLCERDCSDVLTRNVFEFVFDLSK
jgi:hypothetical protein